MFKKLITISITAIASLQAATTYNKSLSDGNDNLNYWSDTTSSNLTNHTLVGATEVFTIGSRKNIPNIPTSSIKVSTNKLCSDDRKNLVSCSKSDSLEPRYTDDGLATTGEANLRTWVYSSVDPKRINNLIDAFPVNAVFGTEQFDQVVQSTYGSFSKSTIYVDRNNKVGSINGLNYQKYCYKVTGATDSSRCSKKYNWWGSSAWLIQNTTYTYRFLDNNSDGTKCYDNYYGGYVSNCGAVGTDVWYH